jgi:protein SCO1/2
LGSSFRIVTVVLDPQETPAKARETKLRYLDQLSRAREAQGLPAGKSAEADESWTFLVGAERDIRSLADAVGFGYAYHPGRKEYLHPATFMMITPTGRVGQYVYGVHFEPPEVEAAIASAAMDITSESTQDFILSCYHYEAPEGLNAFRIMQIAGIIFALGVVMALGGLHLRSRLARRPAV